MNGRWCQGGFFTFLGWDGIYFLFLFFVFVFFEMVDGGLGDWSLGGVVRVLRGWLPWAFEASDALPLLGWEREREERLDSLWHGNHKLAYHVVGSLPLSPWSGQG